jgi:hypothetical protein
MPIVFLLAAVGSYYAYRKMTFPAVFCGSFAQLDDEIGWVLRPNSESCYGFKHPEDPSRWAFYSRIFTDENGFRAPGPNAETPSSGIMTIGDSWTFGYGVDYVDSYPGWLSALGEKPVVNLSSPAYSAVQAIALAERWLEALDPDVIIFLDSGFWGRGACRGRNKPRWVFKPCYWFDPVSNETIRVVPPTGLVERASVLGVLPGGMLGAGEDGWNYFLISRPVMRLLGFLVQLDLLSGMAHDFKAVGVNPRHIKAGVIGDLTRLAALAKVPLILLDPSDAYAEFDEAFIDDDGPKIVRIGSLDWQRNVEIPASALSPDQQRVPFDGHFGPGKNRLIAEYVARILERYASR